MRVELAYPGGVTGRCTWDMDAAERTMTWSVTGTEGVAHIAAFAVPHTDNRLVVTREGRISEEILGDEFYTTSSRASPKPCGTRSPSRPASTAR